MRLVHFRMERFLNSKSITLPLRAPVPCPLLVTLQQRRSKLSRVIGNCIPMRKRHSSHAFWLKSGKQWKTGKEWERWMMIDDGSCVACKLQTISEETRETRCWGDEVRADLCSFILEEGWIFFTWIEPDLSSTCRELIQQQKKHGLCFWVWCKKYGLQQFSINFETDINLQRISRWLMAFIFWLPRELLKGAKKGFFNCQ